MSTVLIIILGLIVMGSIITGIVQAENSDFASLHAVALITVLTFTIAFVVIVNQSETVTNSNTLVKPLIEIETIQNDSSIIKSDTTYIYRFENNN